MWLCFGQGAKVWVVRLVRVKLEGVIKGNSGGEGEDKVEWV